MTTVTLTDGNGATASCTATVTVEDNTAPVAPAAPADLELDCAAAVPPPVDLTAQDNCDGAITVSPTVVKIFGSCVNDFTEIRTWTFTDVGGNTSSFSQTITVSDDTAPAAPAAPSNLTLQCADDVPAPIDLTAEDNCDGAITVSPGVVRIFGSCVNDFTEIRTWTFSDVCGNTSSVSQTITVSDDTAPAAPAAPSNLTLQCADDVPAPIDLTAEDNCDGAITVSPSVVKIFGSCVNDFTEIRTWTFSDVCGNTSSVSQTITVSDDTAPVAPAAPSNLTLQCADAIPPPVDLTATDNCDGAITVSPSVTVIPGSNENDVTQIRTWTFSDVCGNTSSVNQTITVGDDTPPVLECRDIMVDLPASGNDTIVSIEDIRTLAVVEVSDNCGSTSGPFIDGGEPARTFSCSQVGEDVSFTLVTNDGSNPSVRCTVNVTVNDVTPPVLECRDITVNLPSTSGDTIRLCRLPDLRALAVTLKYRTTVGTPRAPSLMAGNLNGPLAVAR
jgi:hypothetical protein